jgi:hypothetical protein
MHGFSWRRSCDCRGVSLHGRRVHLHRLRRPGRFRNRLRPRGPFPRHRHRRLGIGIHRLRLGRGRRRLRHRLRPVRHRLLHRLRGRRALAVTFGSHNVVSRIRGRLGPRRKRLLHRQGRLGTAGVGCLRFSCFRGLCRLRGFYRLPRHCRLGGPGRLSGIRPFIVGYRRLRGRADGFLFGSGSLRWHTRRHLRFGQVGQQRFHVAGHVRRISRVRRERFFFVHGAQSKSVYLRCTWLEKG